MWWFASGYVVADEILVLKKQNQKHEKRIGMDFENREKFP